jgi:hypothetical protein
MSDYKHDVKARAASIMAGFEGGRAGKPLNEVLRDAGLPPMPCHVCGAPQEKQLQPDDPERERCRICGAYVTHA